MTRLCVSVAFLVLSAASAFAQELPREYRAFKSLDFRRLTGQIAGQLIAIEAPPVPASAVAPTRIQRVDSGDIVDFFGTYGDSATAALADQVLLERFRSEIIQRCGDPGSADVPYKLVVAREFAFYGGRSREAVAYSFIEGRARLYLINTRDRTRTELTKRLVAPTYPSKSAVSEAEARGVGESLARQLIGASSPLFDFLRCKTVQ